MRVEQSAAGRSQKRKAQIINTLAVVLAICLMFAISRAPPCQKKTAPCDCDGDVVTIQPYPLPGARKEGARTRPPSKPPLPPPTTKPLRPRPPAKPLHPSPTKPLRPRPPLHPPPTKPLRPRPPATPKPSPVDDDLVSIWPYPPVDDDVVSIWPYPPPDDQPAPRPPPTTKPLHPRPPPTTKPLYPRPPPTTKPLHPRPPAAKPPPNHKPDHEIIWNQPYPPVVRRYLGLPGRRDHFEPRVTYGALGEGVADNVAKAQNRTKLLNHRTTYAETPTLHQWGDDLTHLWVPDHEIEDN